MSCGLCFFTIHLYPPSGSVSNDIGFNLHNHFYIYMNDSFKGRADNEIVFSRSVKAGKRIYYIDVKQDRNSELYLSITESKRIKDGDEESRPVFEKHKIFLYREDLNKFLTALQAAAECPGEGRSHPPLRPSQRRFHRGRTVVVRTERGNPSQGGARL